jgi:hypothetical protein
MTSETVTLSASATSHSLAKLAIKSGPIHTVESVAPPHQGLPHDRVKSLLEAFFETEGAAVGSRKTSDCFIQSHIFHVWYDVWHDAKNYRLPPG